MLVITTGVPGPAEAIIIRAADAGCLLLVDVRSSFVSIELLVLIPFPISAPLIGPRFLIRVPFL